MNIDDYAYHAFSVQGDTRLCTLRVIFLYDKELCVLSYKKDDVLSRVEKLSLMWLHPTWISLPDQTSE